MPLQTQLVIYARRPAPKLLRDLAEVAGTDARSFLTLLMADSSSHQEAADRVGVSRRTITDWLRWAGVKVRRVRTFEPSDEVEA